MLRNLKEICTDVIINEIFLGIVTSDIEKCIINPIKQTLKKNLNAVTSIFQAVIRIKLTQLVLTSIGNNKQTLLFFYHFKFLSFILNEHLRTLFTKLASRFAK